MAVAKRLRRLRAGGRRSSLDALGTAVAVLACAAAGCAGGPAPRAVPPGSAEPLTLPASAFSRQYLFRVSYSGAGPDGSGRLTLYLDRPDRYLLRAVDPLGRTAWSLEAGREGYLLVDERERLFCRGERVLELTELDLGPLPPDGLPAVLLGYLPVHPPEEAVDVEGSFSFRDAAGRSWRGSVGAAGLEAWTLERGGEPRVWWTRDGDGGILSHRRGEQFRWRRTVSEPLTSAPVPLAPPEGYREVVCHGTDLQELRQDQPPSGGGGAPA